MTEQVNWNIGDMRIGVEAVAAAIPVMAQSLDGLQDRNAMAPWVYQSVSAELRNGSCAAMEPERWWQVADGIQMAVDYWIDHGTTYSFDEELETNE
jgi:hypothetical protein